MTVMKSRKYYTPVEFARLFRIDRQTLIYCDNHGIFSPSLKTRMATATTPWTRSSVLLNSFHSETCLSRVPGFPTTTSSPRCPS